MQKFGTQSIRQNLQFHFSVYFLKGNDSRILNISQQLEISSIISPEKLSSSALFYNPIEAMRKYDSWKKMLPWIQPHYAVKSSPCEMMISDFASRGAGMDCASKAEIMTSLAAGVPLEDIVYSNSIKSESDLLWAGQAGVQLTTADTIQELEKIQKYAPNMRVLWRIAIKEDTTDTLLTPFSGKFGDDLENDEMIEERMAQIAEMGVILKGIHFHCGSSHHGSSGFGKAVKLARRCMEVGRSHGHEMSILDIGGGFPSGDLPEKTIEALRCTENDPLGYRVIAEPGRHFSRNSFYLLTRILGKRVKHGKPCYHMNDSLYHSFNCNLMDGVSFENSEDQFYSKVDDAEEPSGIFETRTSTLLGMTCDGMDIIAKSMQVPIEAKVGDWFCFSGMGAYTYGSRSNFNGMNSTERVIRWPAVVGETLPERSPSLAT